MVDFMISLVYGMLWLSDVLQLTCLPCWPYQAAGVPIFFTNAWIASVALLNFDETNSLKDQFASVHDDVMNDVQSKVLEAKKQTKALMQQLTKGLMKEMHLLIEDFRVILELVQNHCPE